MKRFPRIVRMNSEECVLDESKIVISFREETTLKTAVGLTRNLNLVLVENDLGDSKELGEVHGGQINHTTTKYWFRTPDNKGIDEKSFRSIEEALEKKSIGLARSTKRSGPRCKKRTQKVTFVDSPTCC